MATMTSTEINEQSNDLKRAYDKQVQIENLNIWTSKLANGEADINLIRLKSNSDESYISLDNAYPIDVIKPDVQIILQNMKADLETEVDAILSEVRNDLS